MVPKKEEIECLNFLGHKSDLDSESKNVNLLKGAQYVQIKPVGLSFTGHPIRFIQEKS